MNALRSSLIVISALYALGLTLYLILRLAFGDGWWWLALANNFAPFYFLPLFILLPLALLLRARPMVFLLPFALIGLAWFGPYFLPKQSASISGTALRVMTFNVWNSNPDLSQVEGWLRETDADIVMLQEVSRNETRDIVPRLADVYPYSLPDPNDTSRWWGGNVTLSREPILTLEFLDTIQADDITTHYRLLIETETQVIAVYNIHLDSPGGESRVDALDENYYGEVLFGYDTALRNQQLASLLDILDAETYPFIVGGDFNTSDQAAIYGQLAVHMRDSFREAGWGLGASWPVSQSRGLPAFIPPLVRIDYLWHSDHFRAVEAQQGPALGSDHLPLMVTLEDH
jgi:vancomycin resistance protein VanJ